MTKIEVEICDYWDGIELVCDFKRCNERECFPLCYHKPYRINGAYYTVVIAMSKLFTFAEINWLIGRVEYLEKSVKSISDAYNRDFKEAKRK